MNTARTVKAEEALAELVEAERCGDSEAATVLREALLRDRNDVGGHRRIAVALMHGGLTRKAIAAQVDCVNAGMRIERRLADDENLLVAMMLMLGDARSAVAFGARIVAQWPDYMPGWENYAYALTQVGDLAKAADAYRHVLEVQPDKLNAIDGLARCLAGTDHHEEAIALGRRSLEAKGKAARERPRIWTMPQTPPAFDAAKPERNVIAYSLWGANPRYLVTAERNARIARDIYPGWTCRFYHDASVPEDCLKRLRGSGAACIAMPDHVAMEGLMWRFHVAGDPGIDRFLVRDADSLLTVQERIAVDDWIASGRRFHLMRDWYSHTDLMLAGLWGGCGGILTGITGQIAAYASHSSDRIDRKLDQRFLADIVWPSIHEDCLTHDSYFGCFDARPFPPWGRLPSGHHVGQNAAVHGRGAS